MTSRYFAIFLLALFVCSCSQTISITTSAPENYPAASSTLIAGMGQSDLAPPPGYPMSGYSINSHFSHGVWEGAHPHATALYLQSPNGTPFVFVTTDLFAISDGLKHRVTQLFNDGDMKFLAESDVLLAATHSHHSIGVNIPDYAFSFASVGFGFDSVAFEWTAHQIASAVRAAYRSREASTAMIVQDTVRGISKNRSVRSYLRNSRASRAEYLVGISDRERKDFVHDKAKIQDEPWVSESELISMVDPTLTMLVVRKQTGALTGILATYAVHPTATGDKTEIYSADLFGLAATYCADAIKSDSAQYRTTPPLVAFFNGAEGDVAPQYYHHDRADAVRIAHRLADSMRVLWHSKPMDSVTTITHRTQIVGMESQPVALDPEDKDCYCQLPSAIVSTGTAMVGAPVLGGASDGRTYLNSIGVGDRLLSDVWDPAQGYKMPANDYLSSRLLGEVIKGPVRPLFNLALTTHPATELPISIHQLSSNFYLVGTPGEFSTMLGRRIRRSVAAQLGIPKHREAQIIIVGLSDAYTSYVTTPCEYNEQAYEGASDYFGISSGQLFAADYRALAAMAPDAAANRSGRSQSYSVGGHTTYGPQQLEKMQMWNAEEGLANLTIRNDGAASHFHRIQTGDRIRFDSIVPIDSGSAIEFTFEDSIHSLHADALDSKGYYPKLAIVNAAGTDTLHTDMLLTVDVYKRPLSIWTARVADLDFIAADPTRSGDVWHFTLERPTLLPGESDCSASFRIRSKLHP